MFTSEEIWLVLTLHVLGATIWVGGTILLAAVVAGVRQAFPSDPDSVYRVTSQIGRAFAWVMWPALFVTVVTGLANLSWYVPPPRNWTGVPGGDWLALGEGLVALMALSAGLHTFVVGPRIRQLRVKRVPVAEWAVLRVYNRALEAISLVTAILVIAVMVVLGSI